jgi:Domain of unknown function (DUF4340)
MRRTWITLAVMLALVLGLGTWLGLRPADVKPERVRVSSIAPASARELRIEWPGKTTLVLTKTGDAWRIVAPYTGRAEPLRIDRILSLLDATSELAMPATDLAQFELDRPRARITVNGEAYALGGINTVTGGVYVQRGNQVLLLEPRYAGLIPADAQSLNDRRLLATNETPAGFSFPQFKVTQQDGKWNVSPRDGDLGQDDLLRWVEGWQLASALRAERFQGRAPASHITIDLRDGRSIAIGVSELDGEIAFTRYDEHMRYYFFAGSARRLLAPPGANLSANAK